MTAAYAFTDYRAQGQTIPSVLVDIGKPPTGTLSLFNLYVALSRKLLAEDDRLERLNEQTARWWKKMKDTLE
ncbi:hypothetical protein F5879DRAFT_812861 [Lentinula edodes]|uniref:uncharacterized protein n=1 Tax=Lentinula edodes TaxID=5353 RepID=UPI001E8CFCFE|nr:uncharacterized protein C8R40DRAFT_1055707 [Lentinula edodes]KAH7870856.1 hypothetical protein C8R40DRAFT_1055707 [Lentinula edodes]KAJ3898265.1 hypothetical protein F5879DRAFT_812861 [Lentinula edodes]KAJ3912166.1 hypothetical protein F5877DRAFT_54422 [Lentinula edodes]